MAKKANKQKKLIRRLKEESVHIYNGMLVFYPVESEQERIFPMFLFHEKKYSVNNYTVCFIYKGEGYVTPETKETIEILEELGFERKVFHVPFSNGEYPKSEKDRWKKLIMKAYSTV